MFPLCHPHGGVLAEGGFCVCVSMAAMARERDPVSHIAVLDVFVPPVHISLAKASRMAMPNIKGHWEVAVT